MKNLYLIPTPNKSSRLYKNKYNKLSLSFDRVFETTLLINQNIYITNNEDIKENDYILTKDNRLVQVSYLLSRDLEGASKVILTTDRELIEDGIQHISEKFLEWFVKDPSCERVEVEEKYRKCCRNTDGKNENCIEPINCEGWLNNEYERPYKTNCDNRFNGYKIIIPKEEQSIEQYLAKIINVDYIRLSKYTNRFETSLDGVNWCEDCRLPQFKPQEEPKQETLEEVAENELRKQNWDTTITLPFNGGFIEGFQQGAKWQQEQDKNKYSEEEVIELLKERDKHHYESQSDLHPLQLKVRYWFEKFKKK